MASGLFYMLCVYVLVPVLIAGPLFGGRPVEVLQAYGIWITLLLVLGFLQGGAHGEGYGWMLIIGMFTTVFAIPILVLLLKFRNYLKSS